MKGIEVEAMDLLAAEFPHYNAAYISRIGDLVLFSVKSAEPAVAVTNKQFYPFYLSVL